VTSLDTPKYDRRASAARSRSLRSEDIEGLDILADGSIEGGPRPVLSVVVPCFNEVENLIEVHRRLTASCQDTFGDSYEILYVNDGSTDSTWPTIELLVQQDAKVIGVDLSRNFGHQAAVTAGLEYARGDLCFILDADLQDPPELLATMLRKMETEEADVVYGKRTRRHGESHFKLITATMFYRLINVVSEIELPIDTGDFRLMTRRVVDALRSMPEQQRFVRGMVAWVGFRQVALPYEREERFAGRSSYPFSKMLRLSIDAFTGFSIAPLRMATLLALGSMAIAIAFGIYIFAGLLTGRVVPGWASIMGAIVFFSSVQLFVMGILGEYLGLMEAKRRPLFLVNSVLHQSRSRKNAPISERVFEPR
jgi:polyisoprenyl-phosphate glycosyltransferase